MLELKEVCKQYEENQILHNINLTIKKGEFCAIMGQSGCGKSTLLYCVSGMDRATKGEILFEGKALSSLSEKEMERIRLNKMGFVFQRPNFLKNLSIEDNILFPALQAGRKKRREIEAEAERLMQRMRIREVADFDIRKVSGGQLQRAAICRAMINHPDILFGDEPTGALNSSATEEVMDIINQIHEEGTTVLLVTHDAKVAARADKVVYLEDGEIKSVVKLGRYKESEYLCRHEKLKQWLEEMGF